MDIDHVASLVSALGWPICSAIAMFAALVTVGRWYKSSNDNHLIAVSANADLIARLNQLTNAKLAENSQSMDANTRAVNLQTAYLAKFGDDPKSICQAQVLLDHYVKVKVNPPSGG